MADKSPGNAKKKRGKGRPFQPGNNANPRGRPPKGYSIAEFMRAKLEENGGQRLEALFAAMYQKATDPSTPIGAAQELLTRAYGKPVDQVEFLDKTPRERPDGVLDLARHLRTTTSASGPTQSLD